MKDVGENVVDLWGKMVDCEKPLKMIFVVTERGKTMKHKAIRVDNLMYKGCEPHWQCTLCGNAVPFHCYTKKEFENRCCGCHKINCVDCTDHPTEKGGVEE